MKKPTQPLRRRDDKPEMVAAIDELERRGHQVTRPSDYQLKVGSHNFWPGKGTISIDGVKSIDAHGLDDFIALLPASRPGRVHQRPTPSSKPELTKPLKGPREMGGPDGSDLEETELHNRQPFRLSLPDDS